MSLLAAGLSAGSGLLTGLLNIGSSHYFTKKQWERDDTAVQRRVQDLVNAGLSPTLAAGSSAENSQPMKADFNNLDFGKQFLSAQNQALQNDVLKEQKDYISAQADYTKTLTKNADISQMLRTIIQSLGGAGIGGGLYLLGRYLNNKDKNNNDNSNNSTPSTTEHVEAPQTQSVEAPQTEPFKPINEAPFSVLDDKVKKYIDKNFSVDWNRLLKNSSQISNGVAVMILNLIRKLGYVL